MGTATISPIPTKVQLVVPEPEKMIIVPEQINDTIEIIPEKRRRGQRGADKKPRRFNKNSLQNLKPFRPTNTNLVQPSTNLPQSSSKNNNLKIIGITLGCVVIAIGVTYFMYRKHLVNQT